MEPIKIVKGTAPIILIICEQNGTAMDLSGAGVSATLKMERIDSPSTTFTATGTGLNSSGYAYFTFTTTASSTAAEYAADIIVSGLSSGSWGCETPLLVVVRDNKGA